MFISSVLFVGRCMLLSDNRVSFIKLILLPASKKTEFTNPTSVGSH